MDLPETSRHSGASIPRRLRTPRAYRICDGFTEAVLYSAIIFAPWAFGTTEPWSIWTMNVAGFVLGALLLGKWLIRWRTGYAPVRWEAANGEDERLKAEGRMRELRDGGRHTWPISRLLTIALAVLTVLVLAYSFVSAVNARSTFFYHTMSFEPHDHIAWLPHSYDSWATWQSFWMYLGLALTFWATRDWLLGKTSKERREERDQADRSTLPARLRRLLWVFCLNGGLLALECILQRLSGTNKLLWLLEPTINRSPEAQFGPYAYRSNAAQYFNLLWPVCLGFWWMLRHEARGSRRAAPARLGSGPHILLLPCAIFMAAAPIISTSRGGAIVAAGSLLVALTLLSLFRQRGGHWLTRLGIPFLVAATLGLAGYLGWEKLEGRLQNIFSDNLSGRTEIYRNAEQMARDFPLFGTGPGTFPWVYHLYRADAQAKWAAYAHNDWLETRITLGWAGFSLVLALLSVMLARGFAGGGIRAQGLFVAMLWLAEAGCLIHARFDFPFQIYSTLALFLHWCAVLFCLSRTPESFARPA